MMNIVREKAFHRHKALNREFILTTFFGEPKNFQ